MNKQAGLVERGEILITGMEMNRRLPVPLLSRGPPVPLEQPTVLHVSLASFEYPG
jgi:hypothetical protein